MQQRGASAVVMGAFLLLALVALEWPGAASAQTSQPEPYQATAGPYLITLEEGLSTLSLGQAVFVVTVQESATGRLVPNARVALLLQRPSSPERARSLPLDGPDSPGRYSARVNLDSPGVWLVAVEVSSPLGTVVVDAPQVQVQTTRRFTSGSLVFVGVTLVLVGGTTYVRWRARRARRNTAAAASHRDLGG